MYYIFINYEINIAIKQAHLTYNKGRHEFNKLYINFLIYKQVRHPYRANKFLETLFDKNLHSKKHKKYIKKITSLKFCDRRKVLTFK